MAQTSAATPPASSSTTSPVIVDSMEPDTPCSQSSDDLQILASPEEQSDARIKHPEVPDFKPLQMLMKTPMSIEYGENLTGKLTAHEEIMRCHSKTFDQLCIKAKPWRESYAITTELTDRMARCVFPEMRAHVFEHDKMEKKVIPLILQAYDQYPLNNYQTFLKQNVDKAVEEQVAQKNIRPAPSSASNSRKKDQRDMSRSVALDTRLAMLTSKGVHGVAGEVFAVLHVINKTERTKAVSDAVKAAAQRRILLPKADDATVQMLIQWIYSRVLHCQDASQIYALLHLSRELGVEALSEVCLTKLANGASDVIEHTLANGIRLGDLLVHGSGSANNLLEVVFINVFQDEDPPIRLLRLVVEALAENIDMKLWLHLRDLIHHKLALHLIEAMVVQQQVKSEYSSSMSVKLDDHRAATP